MTTSQVTSKPLWRRSLSNGVVLASFAALFNAFVLLSDTNVMSNVITHEETLVAILVYLTMGSWIGLVFTYVYNRFFGKTIDPEFKGEKWITGKHGLLVAAAGIAAGLGTFAYLSVAVKGDPSILIALSNVAIIYLAIYDYKGKGLGSIVIAAILVLVGAGLAAVGNIGDKLSITFVDFFMLAIVTAGFKAVGAICIDKVSKVQNMVNVAFCRFFWLAVTASVVAPAVAIGMGHFSDYISLLFGVWWKAFPWVMLTMFFAYGNNTLMVVAQKFVNPTKVNIIAVTSVVLAVPVTILASWFWPATFELPQQGVIWVLRAVGTILIFCGLLIVLRKK